MVIEYNNEPATDAGRGSALAVELNGINVIDEAERKGAPRSLFWPWFAANVSVLGIGYGAYLLGFFGVSFTQALIAGLIGTVVSFLLCGVVAIAGKRGSAPTMIESRAAFGVNGNKLPGFVSWVLLVGWETVLAALAVLATATVFDQLGWSSGPATKLLAFVVVIVLVIGAGVLGFDTVMRVQQWITIATIVLTVGYMALTFGHIHFSVITANHPAGPVEAWVGAGIFALTGFGLGWINSAADYSRYLPRSASSAGVVAWTTIGAASAPIILVGYGLLLAGSDGDLLEAIGNDPIGALATILPTWYLIPFAFVAILGLVGGAVLDIYSSGLTLLSLGIRIPRWSAAGIDGVIMMLGSIYFVFIADNFFYPFQTFLYFVGVPVAAWAGVMLADVAMRRGPYAERDLFDPRGRYGSVRWPAVLTMLVGTGVGWGLVTSSQGITWLAWEGYFMGWLGGADGPWATASVGIVFALVIGFLGWLVFGRQTVRRQEALPVG